MKTKTKTKRRLYILLLLLILAVSLNYLSARYSGITEQIYSGGVYKVFSQGLSRLTGLYPYSLAEVIVVLLIGAALWSIIGFTKKLARWPQGRLALIGQGFANLLLAGGIIYFAFLAMWGFNYNRVSIASILGLEIRPASLAELTQVAESLIGEVNLLRSQTKEDYDGVMYTPGGYRDVLERAALGYQAVDEKIPELGGRYGAPKPVALSRPWSYTGIWGVYFPFTAEANVNIAIPAPFLPSTSAHEMAHQRGFAREDEANYIAYLVCKAHPDADFRYSGNLMALVHVFRALVQADPQLQKEMAGTLSPGVKRDLAALEEFNRRHEGRLENLSLKANDLYLKANRQKDGDKSYGRVVDLLIAQHRNGLSR